MIKGKHIFILIIIIYCSFIICCILRNFDLNKTFLNTFKYISTQSATSLPLLDEEKQYVAHAGGQLEDYTYLNNLEAIRNSYNKGVRLIELDIEFTRDNVPIMLHSWDGFITKFFRVPAWKKYYLKEFKSFQMINDWHQLTLDETIKYMQKEFKDMYLITDTKNDNLLLLDIIANRYPNMMHRIIPQVYNQDEYQYAKKLGFENIIYTLYMSEDTKEEIIEFCKRNNPFAITMNTSWANTDLPMELSKLNVYTYAHTINTEDEFEILKTNGIKGVYTDKLFDS